MEKLYLWDEIEGIGALYTEMELVVGVEPVFFVCVQKESNEKYLILTYDSCEGIYVMRKISNSLLLRMIRNQITMEEVFREGNEILKTYIDEDVLKVESYNPKDFDENLLPKKGEFFELHSKKILNYIEYLQAIRLQAVKIYDYKLEEYLETFEEYKINNNIGEFVSYTPVTQQENSYEIVKEINLNWVA